MGFKSKKIEVCDLWEDKCAVYESSREACLDYGWSASMLSRALGRKNKTITEPRYSVRFLETENS